MGVATEGKVSLSVELTNFKDIAGNLKKGISKELKEIPLDINFNNKDLEKKAAVIMNEVNELLSKGRITELDFSEVLPSFISTLKRGDISDEVKLEIMDGFRSGLLNLKKIGVKADYNLLKLFNGKEVKTYFEDLNNIVDVIKTIKGLTKRQQEGLLNTVRPKDFPLTGKEGRGKVEEYTKGAKKISGILQLKDKYSDVIQYATSPEVTSEMIKELSQKTKLTKNDAEDYLGYLLRAKYLSPDSEISQNFDTLIEPIKQKLKEEVIQRITDNTTHLFRALDEIYNSSNEIINYSDLIEESSNSTNNKYKGMYDTDKSDTPIIKIPVEEKTAKSTVVIKNNEEENLQVSEYEQKINEIETEIKKLETELERITQKKKEIEKELKQFEAKEAELNNKINTKKNNIDRNKGKITHAKQNIDLHKKDIESFEQEIVNLKEQNKQLQNKLQQLKNEENTAIEEYSKSTQEIEDLLKKKEKAKKELQDKIKRSEGYVRNSEGEIAYFNEVLEGDFSSKGKDDAWRKLKTISDTYRQFKNDPNSFPDKNKDYLKNKLIVAHYKALMEAKKQGVAESRISKEVFDTDDLIQVQVAEASLEKKRNYERQILSNYQNNIAANKQLIKEIEKEEEELREELNRILEAGFTEQDFIDQRVNKENQKNLESEIEQRNNKIEDLKNKIINREQKIKTEEKTINSAQSNKDTQDIQQLEEEKKGTRKLFEEREKYIKEQDDEIDKILNQLNELEKKKEKLSKQLEEFNNKQNKKNKESAQEDNKDNVETTQESETSETTKGTGTTIPPEQLKKILDLLGNIQKALGTLEDGSDIPSITQSIKGMADALKGLNDALGEIKQKNFNLNIGLPNNNPIGQQGEAKRKILKELEQQYNEYMKFYGGTEGLIASAKKYSLQSSEYGDIGEQIVNQYLMPKQFDTSSLIGQIDELQYKLNLLFQFSKANNIDLSEILSNTKSPSEIIKQINEEIANTNPATAISKIFEDMKISIDASLAQINTESKGFNFLSGSAEEAAEAKRKFVEANKDVLQSIVASMPKIEQEAKALEKIEETESIKNNASNEEDNIEKDIKAEEEKNIELLRIQEARNAIYEQNNSMELEQQKRIEDIKKKKLQTVLQQNRQQEQVNDYNINKDYVKHDKQNRYELVQDQGKQIQLDAQKEKIKQAKKNYQSELEQARLIEQSEQIRNKSIQDSIKTQKAYSDISEQGLQLQENIQKKQIEQNQKQTQLELEQARFIEQSLSVQQKKNQDKIKEYENQLQLYAWDEKGEVNGQLSFLSVIDQKTYDLGEEYKQKIQEEKARAQKIAEEEAKNKPINIPIEGQISFTTNSDINQIGKMINRYTEIGKEQIEKQFASLKNKEDYINSELNIEKVLNPFGNLTLTKNANELIDIDDQIRSIKTELNSSFDSNGKLIADPQRVFELIKLFDNLMIRVKELKAEINSPTSQENVALQLAKDVEKAKKELDGLKEEIDKNLGNSGLFEAQTQKTINTYGTFGGNGEGKRGALIESGDLKDERFTKQQEQVQELVSKLREYKTAIQELQTLKASDNATTEQLTKANDKVKELKDNITTLSQTIKTSGIANASEEQIGKLKSRIESFLQRTPNLTNDVQEQLEEYIRILNSGASVSKTSYNSMVADLNKFKSAQTNNVSIWDLMLMKMKEGIAFLATKFSFYQIFNQFRQGFEVIHQFDDALTEMMKVSDETRTSLERYQKTTFETAEAIGTSALQIQNSTADFMRLGETLDQAAESAKSANVLMNVSEFQSIDEATKSLIAMGAAYNDLSKMNIIDKLNEVGNNYAISTSEAATALQSSASALKTAGNDMDEALALITAGNAVVQDANKVGIKDAQR